MTEGLYGYAVVGADRAVLPPVDGVAPGPLRVVAAPPVGVVVSAVEIAAFEGEVLEENLGRSRWLEETVQGHHRVVQALMDGGTVLPMRFGSIFSDEDSLRSMLKANGRSLVDLLDRLRGQVEFGVTVWAQRTGGEVQPSATGATSGRDYLRRRKAELQAASAADQADVTLLEGIHAALADQSAQSSLLETRRADPAVLLSAAYLVPLDAVDSFCLQVEHVQARHADRCRLELTGPWPPYSFVSLDVAGIGS